MLYAVRSPNGFPGFNSQFFILSTLGNFKFFFQNVIAKKSAEFFFEITLIHGTHGQSLSRHVRATRARKYLKHEEWLLNPHIIQSYLVPPFLLTQACYVLCLSCFSILPCLLEKLTADDEADDDDNNRWTNKIPKNQNKTQNVARNSRW